jgi:hypothetical protein
LNFLLLSWRGASRSTLGRFLNEIETASTALGPGNEQSEAGRVLKLMALQIQVQCWGSRAPFERFSR